MARKISFTKAERAALEAVLETWLEDDYPRGAKRAVQSLLDKMEAASLPLDAPPGLAPQVFLAACQATMGNRLAMPPNPSSAWYQRVGRMLKDLGLDEDGAGRVARAAADWFKYPVDPIVVLHKVPVLLAKSGETSAPTPRGWTARREFDGE